MKIRSNQSRITVLGFFTSLLLAAAPLSAQPPSKDTVPMEADKAAERKVADNKAEREKRLQTFIDKAMRAQTFIDKAMSGADEADLEKEAKDLGIIPSDGKKFEVAEVLKKAKFMKGVGVCLEADKAGRDAAEILKLANAALAVAPANLNSDEYTYDIGQLLAGVASTKVKAVFGKYIEAVGKNGDKEAAAKLAKQIEEAMNFIDPFSLSEMAGTILTDTRVTQRDLPLATKWAKTAVDETGGGASRLLTTYAIALFDSGKITDAVETQKKAVAACKDDCKKLQLEDTLKKYQAADTNKPPEKN